MPMGTIARILNINADLQLGEVESFTRFYISVEKLHVKHLWSEGCKEMLHNPRNAAKIQCRQLKLNMDDSIDKCFLCENLDCTALVSTYNAAKCSCGKFMNRAASVETEQNNGGVFVSETASFIVTDDLHVFPNLTTTAFQLLKTYRNGDLGVVDLMTEMTVNIGFKEMLNLLKCSLQSDSPFTDVFLNKRQNISPMIKFGSGVKEKAQTSKAGTPENTMSIKLVFQKSRNKVLYAESEENFVEFLCSLLTITVGGVVRLLSSDASAASIGNLYSSVSSLNTGRYIKSEKVKETLLNPKLAPKHLCKNHIFHLREAKTHYIGSDSSSSRKKIKMTPINPKFEEEYIRSPAMFMVTDDLVVSPLSSIAGVSFLQRSEIPLSDVEEQLISIGIDEAVNLLRATLVSTSVLTNGLRLCLLK